ncbi:Rhodanese-like protein [Desulfovibrio sp. X2]|uniref:rhodanese-like domain-containing protein n=1 Tax=Desulfovibrio sp. X2 TaxID=941449 RepID=UPI000358ECBC|nr:rhodanese-like domain-containing protein [Desulfovibrio sp. X2]EPR43695.1 Rhodanese-like protein [Desulfovibrio sp. X2]
MALAASATHRKRLRFLLLLAAFAVAAALLAREHLSPDYADLDDTRRLTMAMAMYRDYAKDFPAVPDISAGRALYLQEAGKAVFVDLREPREREVSVIPGALTPPDFLAAWRQDPARFAGKTVVAYCTISYRSGEWIRDLEADGGKAPEVENLAGGLLAWLHAGGPLAGPDGRPTRRVHVYGAKWDLAPRGFTTVY